MLGFFFFSPKVKIHDELGAEKQQRGQEAGWWWGWGSWGQPDQKTGWGGGKSLILWECAVLCLVVQSCPTLWDPMDHSPPGFSVRGILQAGILE